MILKRVSLKVVLISLLVVGVTIGIACATAPEPSASPPPAAAPPAAVEPAATPAPAAPPPVAVTDVVEPKGTLRVAHSGIGFPNWELHVQTFPMNEKAIAFGLYDTLMDDAHVDGDIQLVPSIASSWRMDEEGITLTLNTPDIIPWHDPAYGHLTVDDILFSWERASADGSRWTRVDILRSNFDLDGIEVIDESTLFLPWDEKDLKWDTMLSMPGPVITSKKLAEAVGLDEMNLTAMGTGPMRIVSERSDDHAFTEAVPDHWRETSRVARAEWYQVPEESTRLAMLETGEVDIIQMGIHNAPQLDRMRGAWGKTEPALGRTTVATLFGGLWYQEYDHDGNPTNRTPFTQFPWVGDPADPTSMENARKVRLAMNLAIDREAIVDTILGGIGDPVYGHYVTGPGHPRWTPEMEEKYGYPYDPDRAKALLAEAGYPDGFQYKYVNPTERPAISQEICEAMVNMWDAVGLRANMERTAYTTWRPTLLIRETDAAWCWGSTWAQNPADTLFRFHTRSVWNSGSEYQEALDLELKIFGAADHEESWKVVIEEWIPWFAHEMPIVGAVSFPPIWGVGPRVPDWDTFMGRGMSHYPMHTWRIELRD